LAASVTVVVLTDSVPVAALAAVEVFAAAFDVVFAEADALAVPEADVEPSAAASEEAEALVDAEADVDVLAAVEPPLSPLLVAAVAYHAPPSRAARASEPVSGLRAMRRGERQRCVVVRLALVMSPSRRWCGGGCRGAGHKISAAGRDAGGRGRPVVTVRTVTNRNE
jgi:hypothetical protein